MTPPERVSITAERVDDYADRRYLVTCTLVVPAENVTEAIATVADILGRIE